MSNIETEASKQLLETIKKNEIAANARFEMMYERLADKSNRMAGIIGSYKALLRCAIELSKGEVEIGVEYLESREAEMIERIDELYK